MNQMRIVKHQEYPIPVMTGPRCYERAHSREHLLHLMRAPNVEVIRRHQDGMIVELQIHECGNDEDQASTGGNASTYSHDRETLVNPPRCWMLRRLRKAS